MRDGGLFRVDAVVSSSLAVMPYWCNQKKHPTKSKRFWILVVGCLLITNCFKQQLLLTN